MPTFHRLVAVLVKELIQMRRDRLTFAMMIGIPVMQLVLFGFAIDLDPRNLPAAVVAPEASPFERSLLAAAAHSGYFRFGAVPASEAEAERLLATGEVQFVFRFPPGFATALERGERPVVLVEADATDPAATGQAVAALSVLEARALDRDLVGPLSELRPGPSPFELRVHRRWNPEGLTRWNIVPGLLGVILTMTLVMMTSIAMTRERERGTMENLLATPVTPLEVMAGKILPYIGLGYVQVSVVLAVARFVFEVPMRGDPVLLAGVLALFMATNLSIGFTFSTLAQSQLQAMQMTMFFFLPSLLLSGFMFPFRGMPGWAQTLGECFPLTHFLRIVRGIMLKGNGPETIAPHLVPLLGILAAVATLALLRFQRTLD